MRSPSDRFIVICNLHLLGAELSIPAIYFLRAQIEQWGAFVSAMLITAIAIVVSGLTIVYGWPVVARGLARSSTVVWHLLVLVFVRKPQHLFFLVSEGLEAGVRLSLVSSMHMLPGKLVSAAVVLHDYFLWKASC